LFISITFPYWFHRQTKFDNNNIQPPRTYTYYIDCNLSFVHVHLQATLTGWTCWVSRSKHHKYQVYLHRLFCRTIHRRDTRRVSISNDRITSRRRVFMRVSIIFSHYIFCDISFLYSGSQDTFPGGVLNGRGGVVAPAPLQPRAATIESVFLPLQVRCVVIALILWKTIGVKTVCFPFTRCTNVQ